ncbi:hypothetical protein EVAR_95212_1 [Eumeta japonica]|uniref:Uncharacterized protein n=1 Tax=Eumeta variegata TaxID=151549 RepID=A0A4C1VK46_EUMVA|nr:hypothetical protein EVAR_95212_1 [Eumeta japonica]
MAILERVLQKIVSGLHTRCSAGRGVAVAKRKDNRPSISHVPMCGDCAPPGVRRRRHAAIRTYHVHCRYALLIQCKFSAYYNRLARRSFHRLLSAVIIIQSFCFGYWTSNGRPSMEIVFGFMPSGNLK